ncbi:MAG TPA: DNA internalization-related competence protein ComEC/Rec2 [Castellaniella sp.]|nr:DNA internalization-related competence protein ComEC/Rec2 [Castellaniella sp.]
MIGRWAALGFVAGVGTVHTLADLPPMVWALAPVCGALALWARLQAVALIALAFGSGFAWTVMQAQWRVADTLAPININQVTRVELRIVGLPRLDPDRRQFEAEVLSAQPAGVPRRILVGWGAPGWRGPYAPATAADFEFPALVPGQVWRMALVTRPVRAALNPHGFDYERHAFAQGIRANGTVRGTPVLLRDEPWYNLEVLAQRARHIVREAMRPLLEGQRYGPVLLALSIGDQDGVPDEDWRTFNRTGITHLVSISGSHITMIAAFGGLASYALWRRVRWRRKVLAEYLPAQLAAAWAALWVAWLYCLLAGWGVPARRTFMMLAAAASAITLRTRLGGTRILALAAVAVLLLDPWAVLASGFWLSFGAVAVLLAISTQDTQCARMDDGTSIDASPAAPGRVEGLRLRVRQMLSLAVRAQMAVTLALIAPLAWLFHEVSIVSPLANTYAIPLIGWVITPLSLLAAGCALLPGGAWLAQGLANLSHGVLEAMMQPTQWLGGLRAAHWTVAAAPTAVNVLACSAAALALWPSTWRYRHLAWLGLLPLLAWVPARPAPGDWDLHALDVGQGSALVLQTAAHTLVFDAGPRRSATADEGMRTLLPFLRAQGVRKLDVLVVSHGDLDHAGGVRSLLEGLPVEQAYSSFPLADWLGREARKLGADLPPMPLAQVACHHGAHWRIDGVSFEFLWPLAADGTSQGSSGANASSCVLRVRGAHHTVLLTGDVEARSEADLLARGIGPVDVVVAAHHGSATSSTVPWVQRLAPAHVIAQAGSWNRYGHPAAAVVARWQKGGARFWRTDHHAAILARSHAGALSLYSELESSRRYWHARRELDAP